MGDGVRAGVSADAERMRAEAVWPVQTHSCNVAVVGADGTVPPLDDTDALICLAPGVKVGVRTADCVPVLLYAPDLPAVAAVHAGWKGSLDGIVDHVVDMLLEMGADPARMRAAFGPSVCGKCYEVSDALADSFAEAGFEEAIPGYRHVSLERVNTLRLERRGILPENIRTGPCCTLETASLPSWRRSPTPVRLLTWIKMQK